MNLDSIMQRIKDAIFDDDRTQYQRGESGGLIKTIEDIFGQDRSQQGTINNPRPASEDPYGDPADLQPGGYQDANYRRPSDADVRQQFPNIRPASEDPLGDPADLEPIGSRNAGQANQNSADALRRQYPNLRPASEDPYGDPADQ